MVADTDAIRAFGAANSAQAADLAAVAAALAHYPMPRRSATASQSGYSTAAPRWHRASGWIAAA
jgi:hypothetical protein